MDPLGAGPHWCSAHPAALRSGHGPLGTPASRHLPAPQAPVGPALVGAGQLRLGGGLHGSRRLAGALAGGRLPAPAPGVRRRCQGMPQPITGHAAAPCQQRWDVWARQHLPARHSLPSGMSGPEHWSQLSSPSACTFCTSVILCLCFSKSLLVQWPAPLLTILTSHIQHGVIVRISLLFPPSESSIANCIPFLPLPYVACIAVG